MSSCLQQPAHTKRDHLIDALYGVILLTFAYARLSFPMMTICFQFMFTIFFTSRPFQLVVHAIWCGESECAVKDSQNEKKLSCWDQHKFQAKGEQILLFLINPLKGRDIASGPTKTVKPYEHRLNF